MFHVKFHMGLEHVDNRMGGEIVSQVISPPQTFVITVKSK